MGRKLIDLSGRRFGRLTVIRKAERHAEGTWKWECACDCGGSKVCRGYSLVRGDTRSCGCLQREHSRPTARRHGMSGTKMYGVWKSMLQRVRNGNDASYGNYGGRGIRVCDRWLVFENFYADMGEPPPETSIDRIDVNGDYEPGNCRWVDKKTQCRNRRNNKKVTVKGVTRTLSEWVEITGIHKSTLLNRISKNWQQDRILEPATRRK